MSKIESGDKSPREQSGDKSPHSKFVARHVSAHSERTKQMSKLEGGIAAENSLSSPRITVESDLDRPHFSDLDPHS